jgi:hypothetical protein
MRGLVAALAMLSILQLAEPSWAQAAPDETARAAARKLGYDGIEAYRTGDFVAASERLEAAYAILGVPSLALWSARALAKRGRLVEASERYLVVSTLPMPETNREVHEAARVEAVEERALLMLRIPLVTLRAEGRPADAVVTIDGRIVEGARIGIALPLDPGPHRFEITARGKSTLRELILQEGERVDVPLEVPVEASPPPPSPTVPPPQPSPPPRATSTTPESDGGLRTAGWISLGIGGAGVFLGVVAAGVAVGQNDTLDEVCVDDVCPPSSQADVDAYDRMKLLSTLGFVVGAVGVTTGVVLVLASPSSGGGATVEARVSPGSAMVSGAF